MGMDMGLIIERTPQYTGTSNPYVRCQAWQGGLE